MSLAWEAFGEKNGAASLEEMRARLAKYRRAAEDPRADYTVGCILLEQPFFLSESNWIPAPADWSWNIVRGKGYDARTGEGRRLWERIQAVVGAAGVGDTCAAFEPQRVASGSAAPPSSSLALGRARSVCWSRISTSAGARSPGSAPCPVLDAAHIQPFGANGLTIPETACCSGATSTPSSTAAMSPSHRSSASR